MSERGPDGQQEGARVRTVLAVMASALFVSGFTNTMVNVAIPLIREQFGVSEGQAGWVITGYALPFAVSIPLYGRVSDLFSLRRTAFAGLAVLAAGLLVCALAPTLTVLVAGRALQGVGAGSIPALAFGSIARMLPPGQRGGALGLLSSSVGVGAAAGPVLGGLVAGAADWQSLFYGTLALTLLLLLGAWYTLPETASGEPEETGSRGSISRLDLPGGLLLAAAGLLLFGATQGEQAGFASPLSWGSFLLAALSALGFAWRIRVEPEPFVSPRLFASGAFLAAAAIGFLAQFANIGSLFLAPLLLEGSGGLSPSAAGLVLAPSAVAVAVLSPLAGRLSDRLGSRVVLCCSPSWSLPASGGAW